MKKKLATLWVAWMLAVSPNAHAKTTIQTNERKKDLVEAFSSNQTKYENKTDTISYEDAKWLIEQQQLIDRIKQDEKIQDLIKEYWEEEIDKMIEEIVTSQEVKDVIEEAVKDNDVKKALEKWDKEKLLKSLTRFLDRHRFNINNARFIRNVFIIVVCIVMLTKSISYIRKE